MRSLSTNSRFKKACGRLSTKAYRDALRPFLDLCRGRCSLSAHTVSLDTLTLDRVLRFLQHLETTATITVEHVTIRLTIRMRLNFWGGACPSVLAVAQQWPPSEQTRLAARTRSRQGRRSKRSFIS